MLSKTLIDDKATKGAIPGRMLLSKHQVTLMLITTTKMRIITKMMMRTMMVRMMRFCFFLLSNTFFTDLRLSKAGLRKEGFPSDRYLVKRKLYIALHTISLWIIT